MLVDSHQHFWRYSPDQYPWITERMGVLRRDYLPDDLAPLLRSAGFDATVAVQARQTLAETEWLLELAEQYDWIKGVVGWVDLCSESVAVQLQRFAGHAKLVGVRHVVQDEPDERFMLRSDFQRGLAELSSFGLTYDLLLYPRHLPVAVELVQRFPVQPFVLDHLAKPAVARRQLAAWASDLRRLARCENVYCKLSGLVTEASWGNWRHQDFHPYLDVALESFGPERLMIGSDWPVCTLSGQYKEVLDIVIDYVGGLEPSARDSILGGTCARFYGLE